LGGNFGIFWVLTNEVFSEMGFAENQKETPYFFFLIKKKRKEKYRKEQMAEEGL
jgi:hypothetical protein